MLFGASLMVQTVMNMPEMQYTRVRNLGQRDHLEKGMAAHSIMLAWRIPRTEEHGGKQPMGLQRLKHDCVTDTSTV